MSAEAEDYMRKIAQGYVQNGFQRGMMFDRGKDEAVHRELVALGLIKLMGTKGSSYLVTDAGHDWIMENRDV